MSIFGMSKGELAGYFVGAVLAVGAGYAGLSHLDNHFKEQDLANQETRASQIIQGTYKLGQ